MGWGHSDLSETIGDQRSIDSGSLCLAPFSEAINILQPEIRPRSSSSECFHPTLEDSEGLSCTPFCLTSRYLTKKGALASNRSPLNRDHKLDFHSSLECQWKYQFFSPPRTLHPIVLQGHLQLVNSFQDRGLSERATTLLCASRRSNTESSYSSCWRRYGAWRRVSIPFKCLTSQFDQEKKYWTLTDLLSLTIICQWMSFKLGNILLYPN